MRSARRHGRDRPGAVIACVGRQVGWPRAMRRKLRAQRLPKGEGLWLDLQRLKTSVQASAGQGRDLLETPLRISGVISVEYIVTGHVQPERADVYFSRVEIVFEDRWRAIVSCDSSQITITLKDLPFEDVISAKILADVAAQILVGALGFSSGTGYSIELVQVTDEDGMPHVLGVRPCGPTPEDSLGFPSQDDVFNKVIHLSASDVFFRLAVRDYLRAIRDETDCATYCYRAIEGIKSAFVYESGQNRWNEMHNALGTDRRTIEDAVKKFADPVRHGNWIVAPPTTGAQRWGMLSLTRSILAQYLEYRIGGGPMATSHAVPADTAP